ncbi:hypothetical protein V496_05667, partial [Pseudogymnoascus sp. VKM F-4515 (FW-2607)]
MGKSSALRRSLLGRVYCVLVDSEMRRNEYSTNVPRLFVSSFPLYFLLLLPSHLFLPSYLFPSSSVSRNSLCFGDSYVTTTFKQPYARCWLKFILKSLLLAADQDLLSVVVWSPVRIHSEPIGSILSILTPAIPFTWRRLFALIVSRSMDDEYDSSDLEFEPPPNPFESAGLESIEAIINNAAEDRVTSKKITKELIFVEASKKTEYLTYLWYNRFVAFRVNSIKKSLDNTPSMDELERFLCSIVSRVRPRSNEVPAFTWLRGGLRRLIVVLTFHFADFKVSKHDSLRMKTVFQQLLNDGKITREPSRQVQWIGSVLVRRLITVIFQDAINEGTGNWDKPIQRALSILLISALSCRSGDIMTSTRDTQKIPFLCYNDITVKLVGGDGLENLEAEVLIRNEKKKKHNPQKNRTVRLRVLTDHRDGILCPIKMIIVSAMRLGAISDTTIEGVLGSIRCRQDKTLQWANGRGEKPVLCAFDQSTNLVLIDKAAEIRQAITTIHETSLKAGFCAVVTPHDMRRGAAKDSAHLKHTPTGLATPAVAAELGQSSKSLDAGITAAYVGSRNDDTWSKRVHSAFEDPFGLNVSDTGYKRQKMNRAEMKKLYLDLGIENSSHNEKRKARRKHEAEQEKLWRESQGQQRAKPLLEIGSAHSHQSTEHKENGSTEETSYDLAAAENISALIGNADDAQMDETAETMLFDQIEAPVNLPGELLVPGADFVAFLSKINIVRHGVWTKSRQATLFGRYVGNSRDQPTSFLYRCQKTVGCPYRAAKEFHLAEHHMKCSVSWVKTRVAANKRALQCTYEGCTKEYLSEGGLKIHIKTIHEWTPRPCTNKKCSASVLYHTAADFNKH